MANVFLAQLYRDFTLSFLKKAEWMNPLIFLVLVQSLFPLALGGDSVLLQKLAPAALWVTVLLSTLISLESLFREDFDDGSLEQMLLSQEAFFVFSAAKIVSHWLVSGLPLLLICPLLALSYGLSAEAIIVVFVSLLLATPVLCSISALASALTLNANRGGVLLSLVVLPLYVPIMIFGSGALNQSISGESPLAALYFLCAFLLLSLCLIPYVLAAALKMSINDA